MLIFGIFRWDLESGRVCNGLEMAVGFKWTDSQPISSHVGSFLIYFFDLCDFRVPGSFDLVASLGVDPV